MRSKRPLALGANGQVHSGDPYCDWISFRRIFWPSSSSFHVFEFSCFHGKRIRSQFGLFS